MPILDLFHAAAEALRTAAPLPPLLVTVELVDHGDTVAICPTPEVVPVRREAALRRFAGRHRTRVHSRRSGPVARVQIGGVLVQMNDPYRGKDPGSTIAQGRTAEHADLLDRLALWAQDLPALGVSTLQVAEGQVSDIDRSHHLTVLAIASPGQQAQVLDHLAITRKNGSTAVLGTGLAPTGHQLVVIDPPGQARPQGHTQRS